MEDRGLGEPAVSGVGGLRWRALATSAALVLTTTVLGGAIAPAAGQTGESQGSSGALQDFTSCVESSGAGDVLLLIDESGSLRDSDPGGARVTAAQHLIQQWAQLEDVDLEISVSAFSGEFEEVLPFTPLDDEGAAAVDRALQSFASRVDGDWTDYWAALDGARRSLIQKAAADRRCQAIVWFSDGALDVIAKAGEDDQGKPVAQPYLNDPSLAPERAIDAALEDLCRQGGVADQVRSAGIRTFGIGLAAAGTPESDLDVMRAITTGEAGGQSCGEITTPPPGEYFGVSDLDTLIEAFHRVGQTDGEPAEETLPVCQGELCAEQHKFVLDESVSSVHIFARTDVDGAEVHVIPPMGDAVEVPRGEVNSSRTLAVGEAELVVSTLTDRTMTFDLSAPNGAEPWTGQWGLAFVDRASSTPEGRSRTLMWIRGDLRPTIAVTASDGSTLRVGESAQALIGLTDSDGNAVDPSSLLGEMVVDLSLLPATGQPISIATDLSAADIAEPVELDLTPVAAGPARIRADLQVTTAGVEGEDGESIPGTQFAVERAEEQLEVMPPLGFPTVGPRLSFGAVVGPMAATADLQVTGPGCVWVDPSSVQVTTGPRDIGSIRLGEGVPVSPEGCLELAEDEQSQLPVTMVSEGQGNGALNGSLAVMGGPVEALDRAQATTVSYDAELRKEPAGGVRWLVFILTLLIGVGLPLGLLYWARWRGAVIPARALMSRELEVTLRDGKVLRDGAPLRISADDLENLVSIPAAGGRDVTAESLSLRTRSGWNLLKEPDVAVHAPAGPVSTSALGGGDTDRPGQLPLAVHNSWVAWPGSQESTARLVVLLGVDADDATRERLVESIHERLPEAMTDPAFEPAPDQSDRRPRGDAASTPTETWMDLDDETDWGQPREGSPSTPQRGQARVGASSDTAPARDVTPPRGGDVARGAATDDDWDFGAWDDGETRG